MITVHAVTLDRHHSPGVSQHQVAPVWWQPQLTRPHLYTHIQSVYGEELSGWIKTLLKIVLESYLKAFYVLKDHLKKTLNLYLTRQVS